MSAEQKQQKNPFQDTLNLPRTDFSIRANAQTKEPELLERWERDDLAQKATEKNDGNKKFILHDGPPFANGNLHMGHALTYILKDIVCKAKRMDGYYAPLVPGWDCHGLPIEVKVLTEKGLEKDQNKVDRATFKKYCREFANHWIKVQEQELKGFGKLADYKHAYLTMSPGYEASILRALADFAEKGFIERRLKSVPWCANCQTVLAIAEIEYKDRSDPSLYVAFALQDQTARTIFPMLFEKHPDIQLSFAVWTTTPWTLPLNRAVVLNPTATYVVIQGKYPQQALILAKERAEIVCKEMGIEYHELAECDADVFEGKRAQHPFIAGFMVPILLDAMVVLGDGTACLHCAPGCGPEDYGLALRKGLEVYSPLSADGRYTKGIAPVELEGMTIFAGQKRVVELLEGNGTLLHVGAIEHSYPHCWRCRKGLMFRATEQWFCDLAKNDLLKNALTEIEKIKFIPERGRARLSSFVANRAEWCISRQKQWGVPIPAILCTECKAGILDATIVRAVAERVVTEGIEFWDRMSVPQLMAEKILPKDFACPECGNKDIQKLVLERDILDVWLESGTSSYAVLAPNKKLGVPADMYFEGSDQHRGWFQSSLLCGMVLYGHTPTKTIVSHGYILDEQRRKMSKSLGNVIAPSDIIKKLSRDILRLWAASVDFEDDMVMSEKFLSNVTEVYRKIRNTFRYMVANLYDFDITKDAIEVERMWALDQYALATLHELDTKVRDAYDNCRFAVASQLLNTYCTETLSAVYFDILKDRLYVEKPDSLARRSAQTVLYHLLDVLTKLSAPILSFLSEEVSDFYQKNKQQSIHLQDFTPVLDVWAHLSTKLVAAYPKAYLSGLQLKSSIDYVVHKQGLWTALTMLRDAVLKAIEVQREQGVIKHPYETSVTLFIDPTSDQYALINTFIEELKEKGEDVDRFFNDWFIVSQITIVSDKNGLEQSLVPWTWVSAVHAQGVKCPRCWRWDIVKHHQDLCRRCQDVLK